MSSKVTKKNFTQLIGYNKKSGVFNIGNTVCFRKPLDERSTKIIMSKYKYALGMVSAHNIYRKPNTPYCAGWCHCFRNPHKYFPNKPCILLSESDFVDPLMIKVLPRASSYKWDFFYFTIGGNLGNIYKGMDLFVDSLPILCGKFKFKGIVINYAKQNSKFILSKHQSKILNRYSGMLKLRNKKLSEKEIASVMSRCRFGFFQTERIAVL